MTKGCPRLTRSSSATTRAITSLARSMNMSTIAEGVEDERMRAHLLAERCNEAQGYHFAKPLPLDDLIALGALQVLKGRGIAVPEQLSLIGHNDMPLLDQISPPLSSIRIQHYEMGFRAARLLLEALQQTPGSSAATVLLRPTLIARASTQAPPA